MSFIPIALKIKYGGDVRLHKMQKDFITRATRKP